MNGGTYSESFKEQMIARLVGPRATSAMALSKEVGISQSTLSRWLRDASRVAMRVGKDDDKKAAEERPPRRTQDWTSEQKLRVVLESLKVSDHELGAFLRREGVHEAELREWRETALEALEPAAKKRKKEAKRVRDLEKELRRKEKALAEAAALLVLEKKLQALWGAEDDGTDEENEK